MIYNLYLRGFLKPKHIYHFTSLAREIILYRGIQRDVVASNLDQQSQLVGNIVASAVSNDSRSGLIKNFNRMLDLSQANRLNNINEIKNINNQRNINTESKKVDSMIRLYRLLQKKKIFK